MFFVFVVPANEAFLAATSTAVPHNWMELRASWETSHAIRFAIRLAALCMLVLSVLFETRDDTSQRVFSNAPAHGLTSARKYAFNTYENI